MLPIGARHLQKIAARAAQLASLYQQQSIHTSSALAKWGDYYSYPNAKKYEPFPKDFKEHPDRDLVNFPHPVTKVFPSKVRLGIFPDSWFTIFYPKTGVTGGYLFYGGMLFYLIQKEWWIIDEEIRIFFMLYILFYCGQKMFAADAGKFIGEAKDKETEELESYIGSNTDVFKDAIATQQNYAASYSGLPPLIAEAKRENVQMQLEAEYRRRIAKAHAEVKRRLDYMTDLEEAKRRFQRRYMINWIVDQVKKSITSQTEKQTLAQCVADLKQLSTKTVL